MNCDQLKKDVGRHLRRRPQAERWDGSVQLDSRDDYWSLDAVSRNGVKLTNVATGHSLTLGSDHVREYRSPDFLILHSILIIRGRKIEIEPIIRPKAILDDTQEWLLGIIADYQLRYCAPKLRISRNGSGLFRPENQTVVQVIGVDVGLELFGRKKPEARRLAEFESIMDSIPDEYLRRFSESIYGNPFVIAVTPEGFRYLGMPSCS